MIQFDIIDQTDEWAIVPKFRAFIKECGIVAILAKTFARIFYRNSFNIGLALINIMLLWIFILALIIKFWKIERQAAGLLMPYIIWVTFAMLLNYSLLALN